MKDPDESAARDASATRLTDDEHREVSDLSLAAPRVVHEVVRQQGEEELARSAAALIYSGLAAGVSISASVLAKAFLQAGLPADAPWASLVTSFGYAVGFVIAIMGRLQLFTETTVTAVLPVATRPTLANLTRLLRLWGLVLAANLIGSLLVAWLIVDGAVLADGHRAAVLAISREVLAPGWVEILWRAMPAGFLIASIAWILPNARGSEFWVIVLVTWVVGVGGFSHVVAGSTEAFVLWLAGERSFGASFGGFIVPALIGNVVGGTGLFAVLAHGQVSSETQASLK